jgi:hypothetical protein
LVPVRFVNQALSFMLASAIFAYILAISADRALEEAGAAVAAEKDK